LIQGWLLKKDGNNYIMIDIRACSSTDRAFDYESKGWGFESLQAQVSIVTNKGENMSNNINNSSKDFISASNEINVEEIMDSIKKRIEEKKDSGVLRQKEIEEIVDMELLPLPDFLEIPNVYEQHLYPKDHLPQYQPFHIQLEDEGGSGGIKGLIKKSMQLTRRIFSPLIRFMIRPNINEIKNLMVDLHNENKEPIHYMSPVVTQSKEYIMLLHNAVNNMIVESSKLKTEEELLKTKIKVLEDKIEFLENRERAIEKKVFINEKDK
jgi:cell division ATPase FtsA